MRKVAIDEAAALMQRFGERTGVVGDRPPRRYLWTDAFAVCNYLGLARVTANKRYLDLARGLVDQVHSVLGRHRGDGPLRGWLSGLGEEEGTLHPTRGGLRIGKKLPERGTDEPFDERLEWDRDGQYFHYLTKWMHALDQVSRSTREPQFNLWARELAETAHHAFSLGPPGARRLVWKMSADLTRPLVPATGQHDALDGLVTCAQLHDTAVDLGNAAAGPNMSDLMSDFAAMIDESDLTTADALGLGGLLADASRVDQLMKRQLFVDGNLRALLLAFALRGLQYYAAGGDLRQPASRRLAFRELGLAIGLRGVALMQERAAGERRSGKTKTQALLEELCRHVPLADLIDSFWLDPDNRMSRAWSEHLDINEVMLATSLLPDGFLSLAPS